MTLNITHPIVQSIKGLTQGGRTFRPTDWAERLSSVIASVAKGNRLGYSPHAQPVTLDGAKCVVVNKALAESEPQAYRFLMGFAQDNELQVIEGEDWANTHPEAGGVG